MAVTILAYESEILARKTLEAFLISAKNRRRNDDAETLARIKLTNNLGQPLKPLVLTSFRRERQCKEVKQQDRERAIYRRNLCNCPRQLSATC
ncbi:hypothetical protein Y032_0167g150 [Ancylostoma ceylanicum]|uniref:Uncharacterized protein n=1 Tax=Ancylostoma ceylanicum TaxID=53326 RepID=A0A016SWR7_9BILA|nr:hypothetical protein Y032_0167g150 [Ancylostoma ceylanicum]